jgi:hypothetical protein
MLYHLGNLCGYVHICIAIPGTHIDSDREVVVVLES